jgi:hypothetical protein
MFNRASPMSLKLYPQIMIKSDLIWLAPWIIRMPVKRAGVK